MSVSTAVAERFEDVPGLNRGDAALLLVMPGLFLFLAFMFIPMLYLFGISFMDATPAKMFAGEGIVGFLTFGESTWVGFQNYYRILFEGTFTIELFGSQLLTLPINGEFWNSFGMTWLFVATSVVGKIALSLAIAVVVTHDRVRGRRYLRSLIIIPMGLPAIFIITIWRGMFSSAQYGLINQFIGALGFDSIAWLQQRWMAFLAYNVTEIWLAYPFMVIISVSALQDVPEELHEAAKVDGAGFLSRFFHITLPTVKRPVMFASILTAAASFQQFLIPYVFNEGGPARANELMIVYGYREAFRFQQYGEGAAVMLIAIAFIGVFMFLNVWKGQLAEGVHE